MISKFDLFNKIFSAIKGEKKVLRYLVMLFVLGLVAFASLLIATRLGPIIGTQLEGFY